MKTDKQSKNRKKLSESLSRQVDNLISDMAQLSLNGCHAQQKLSLSPTNRMKTNSPSCTSFQECEDAICIFSISSLIKNLEFNCDVASASFAYNTGMLQPADFLDIPSKHTTVLLRLDSANSICPSQGAV